MGNLKLYLCCYRHLSNLTTDFDACAVISMQRQAHRRRAIHDCVSTEREFPHLGNIINKLAVHIKPPLPPNESSQTQHVNGNQRWCHPVACGATMSGRGRKAIEARGRHIFPDKDGTAAALISNETSRNLSLCFPLTSAYFPWAHLLKIVFYLSAVEAAAVSSGILMR